MISVNKLNDISKVYNKTQDVPTGAPSPNEYQATAIMPVDRVTLSRHALEDSTRGRNGSLAAGEQELTPEDRQVVNDLKQRDAEVKAHEQAHMAAGGGVASGGASYQYQTGPDGKKYAVGGEVQIDLSTEGSPEATIRKMQQIQAAALAPAQPSGADRGVAAQASRIEATARLEKSQNREKEAGWTANRPATESIRQADSHYLLNPTGGHIDLMA